MLSVGLYPNQYWNSEKNEWEDIPPLERDREEYPVNGGSTIYRYSTVPICTSIIHDDFTVTITNEYSEFGGDPIGQLWGTFKPMAPFLGEMAKNFKMIGEQTKVWNTKNKKDESTLLGKATSIIADAFSKMGETNESMSKYLARSLVVQGTRFSYYNGTGIDFGALLMNFTLFSQYNTKKEVFEPVDDQLKKIFPYVVGEFKDFSLKEIAGDDYGEVGEFCSEFLKWQMPPGNFTADMKDVDNVQKGTLKLKIGPYISLENLVIKQCQIKYSKTMVKSPKGDGSDICPHSCEVSLMIQPITKYSRNSLERFIFGKATAESRKDLYVDLEYKNAELMSYRDREFAKSLKYNNKTTVPTYSSYKPLG